MQIPGGHDAIRQDYDAVASDYASRFGGELSYKPLDRALLSALIDGASGAVVADLGCGPGHVAGWLVGQGVDVVGIDISDAMVSVARDSHPEVEFRRGDLVALPARNEEFAAILALHSIIHLTPDEVQVAFAEMHRVLVPGGQLLVAFHIGSDVHHLDEWLGHAVDLDFRFLEPADVKQALTETGFVIEAALERANYPGEVETQRCYLLARRP